MITTSDRRQSEKKRGIRFRTSLSAGALGPVCGPKLGNCVDSGNHNSPACIVFRRDCCKP